MRLFLASVEYCTLVENTKYKKLLLELLNTPSMNYTWNLAWKTVQPMQNDDFQIVLFSMFFALHTLSKFHITRALSLQTESGYAQ